MTTYGRYSTEVGEMRLALDFTDKSATLELEDIHVNSRESIVLSAPRAECVARMILAWLGET